MFANGAAQLEDLELGLKPGTGTGTGMGWERGKRLGYAC